MITDYAEKLKKLPSLLYKLGAQSYIDRRYPRHLFIETTAACNLSCSYCPRERNSSDMDFGLFKQIVDEATGFGPRSFSLHLFGEPFLYRRLFDAIEYIRGANRLHTILLTTNGTLLNKYVDRLVESPVSKVLWSVRPEAKFTPETIEKLRLWGRFTARIIEETVSTKLKKEWEKWPNLERRNLHDYGGNIDIEKFGGKDDNKTRWACYHLFYAPAIAWNGNILLCCADPSQKEVIGKFPEMSMAEAWGKIEPVRQSHLKGKYEGICENCNVWKSYPNIFFGHEFPRKNTEKIPL